MSGNRTFSDWYQENKTRLSEQRKQRYRSDPEYRQRAMQRAADYRTRTRTEKPAINGLTAQQVCDHLGISAWTLHRWFSAGYYPAPKRVDGRLVFSPTQLKLLELIREFFEKYPRRASAKHKNELESVVDVVHHNWSVN